jgi:hypothetical protein
VNYYSKFLANVRPKVIVEVVSYSKTRYAINTVAKSMGIPTIELQHGVMGSNNISYNYLYRLPVNVFPDYVFLYGKHWRDLTRLPLSSENIKVVGWPFLEDKTQMKAINPKKGDKKTILFISQGTIGKELSKVAIELGQLIGDSYRIIYKLHPGEHGHWKKEYPWLYSSGLEVIDNNDYDMHHFFRQTDFQVGVASFALIEGLAYSLKTFVLPFYGHIVMRQLIDDSAFFLVNNTNELMNAIINSKNSPPLDYNYYWEPDSLNKIIEEIYNITELDLNHSFKLK